MCVWDLGLFRTRFFGILGSQMPVVVDNDTHTRGSAASNSNICGSNNSSNHLHDEATTTNVAQRTSLALYVGRVGNDKNEWRKRMRLHSRDPKPLFNVRQHVATWSSYFWETQTSPEILANPSRSKVGWLCAVAN
jgi:hypothetical protein